MKNERHHGAGRIEDSSVVLTFVNPASVCAEMLKQQPKGTKITLVKDGASCVVKIPEDLGNTAQRDALFSKLSAIVATADQITLEKKR